MPDEEFAVAIAELLNDPARLAVMRRDVRTYSLCTSWDSVFEGVYERYPDIFPD